jgi:hypothetical protein
MIEFPFGSLSTRDYIPEANLIYFTSCRSRFGKIFEKNIIVSMLKSYLHFLIMCFPSTQPKSPVIPALQPPTANIL